MKPPDSAEVFETVNSKYWFDGDILFLISKNAPPGDEETRKNELDEFKKRIGGRKVCAIMDVSEARPSTKEERERNTEILPELFKAIAFIIKNPLTKMLAHIYLGMKPMSFPVKMCTDEKEARKWIKQYC